MEMWRGEVKTWFHCMYGIICNPMYDCVSREGDSSTNNRYAKAEPASR